MIAVTVDHVTKRFGRHVTALDEVSATVASGTLHAVLGPSGCGKTTLLRVLAGFEPVDAGTIRFDDAVMSTPSTTVPPERRRVGIVPQDGALFPHLDVAGNIAFGLHRESRPRRRARVAELLELIGLTGLEHRRPHELSGGQQQRVALARALAPRPALVLLDEPFTALDAGLRAGLRDDVAAVLRAAATTAVLVTHDQSEAFAVADAVAVMRDGRIIQTAAPEDLYRVPVDLATARFIGAAIELPGTVAGDDVECALGRLPAHHTSKVSTDVVVLLRPEQLGPDPDGVPAVVKATRFEGASVSVDLAIGGAVVTAAWPSHAVPDVDSKVTVSVTGRAVTYPAPEL